MEKLPLTKDQIKRLLKRTDVMLQKRQQRQNADKNAFLSELEKQMASHDCEED